MELLLIRHAEPVRIVAADGPADPHLTDRGYEQAQRLAEYLRAERVDGVWSSPMLRARETAAPVAEAFGTDVIVDHELAEYDKDATAYIPLEDLKADKSLNWAAIVEANLDADGRDPIAFQQGVVTAMDHIVTGNPGSTVAVVCHGGVINAYLAHILGIARILWFDPAYSSINRVLASRQGDRSLRTLNETAHLRGTDLLV